MNKEESGYCQMMGLLAITNKNWICKKCGKENSTEDFTCWKCKSQKSLSISLKN